MAQTLLVNLRANEYSQERGNTHESQSQSQPNPLHFRTCQLFDSIKIKLDFDLVKIKFDFGLVKIKFDFDFVKIKFDFDFDLTFE